MCKDSAYVKIKNLLTMFSLSSPANVFFLPIQLGRVFIISVYPARFKGRVGISDELGSLMFAQQMFTFKAQHSLPQTHISSFISPSSPSPNLSSQSVYFQSPQYKTSISNFLLGSFFLFLFFYLSFETYFRFCHSFIQ